MSSTCSLLLVCMDLLLAASGAQSSYPYRPTYHFVPDPPNWMNDPNGPFYDARTSKYHLFFQYETPRVWGHAISTDLLHWDNLAIAIENNEAYNSGGVYTGSTTVLSDGSPVIMYSVSSNNKMCLAYPATTNISNDMNLTNWSNYAANCVLNANATVPAGRDPSTSWTTDGGNTWTFAYATQGPGSNGAAVTFQTNDWKTWRRAATPLTYSNTTGGWECVDFFVLPQSQQTDGITHVAKSSNRGKDWWALGTYNEVSTEFVPFANQTHNQAWNCSDCIWDYGAFYASKSFYDSKNERQLIYGWLTEQRECSANPPNGQWCGAQTLPREIKLLSASQSPTGTPRILTYPIAEFDTLRIAETKYENDGIVLTEGETVFFEQSKVGGNVLDIEARWQRGGDCAVWILSDRNGTNKIRVGVNFNNVPNAKQFYIDGHGTLQQPVAGWNGEDEITLRILVDHSLINVFINGGITVASWRYYPTYDSFHAAVAMWNHGNGGNCVLSSFVSYNVSASIPPPVYH